MIKDDYISSHIGKVDSIDSTTSFGVKTDRKLVRKTERKIEEQWSY